MTHRARGVALITALLLTVFLLVLGLAFLTYVERDYHAASQQDKAARAYYLAQSGLEYYRTRPGKFSAGISVTLSLPPGDPHQSFEVTLETDGTVRSRGSLVDASGRPGARRTLVAPQGDFTRIYDESQ